MMPKTTEVKLSIGDFVFSLTLANPHYHFIVNEPYTRFVESNQKPDITLRVHCGDLPEFKDTTLLFDSEGVWQLHRNDKKLIYLSQSMRHAHPLLTAVLAENFEDGDIYLPETWQKRGAVPLPFDYPFSEWLTINLLSQNKGLVLHACGANDHGQGRLFLGSSGAGKSTMGRLWQNVEGINLLSDDRIIVRKQENGDYWMYGTPWNGEAWLSSPDSVPLTALFLIRQAKENYAKRLTPATTAVRLFLCTFPTFWNADGTAFTLKFLEELLLNVPCYELGFVPDMDAVTFIQQL